MNKKVLREKFDFGDKEEDPNEDFDDGLSDEGDEDFDDEGLGDEDFGDEDFGDEGLGDEDEECSVNKDELRQLLDDVESGEVSADEAFEQLCNSDDLDLGDEGLDDEGLDDLGDEGLDDLGDEDDLNEEVYDECMEGIVKIASMLTDDPDIMQKRS